MKFFLLFLLSKNLLFHFGKFFLGFCLNFPENLGKTLKRISQNGKEDFYSGETAKRISNFFEDNEGILSFEDLRQYKLRILNPVCGSYRHYEVCSMAPPSSGGIALVQILNILENINLSSLEHNSEEYLKILISAMDYAYKDRAEYLGDPDLQGIQPCLCKHNP